MKDRVRKFLEESSVIYLEINEKEYELNINEFLNLGEDFDQTLYDVQDKMAVLTALESLARYKLNEARAELKSFVAEKDGLIRSTAPGRSTDKKVLSEIESSPEWLSKKQDINLCLKELNLIEGLKEALIVGIDARLVISLKDVSSLIADKKLEDDKVIGLLTDKLATKKKRRIKKKIKKREAIEEDEVEEEDDDEE